MTNATSKPRIEFRKRVPRTPEELDVARARIRRALGIPEAGLDVRAVEPAKPDLAGQEPK
jgi:hypothetical protein